MKNIGEKSINISDIMGYLAMFSKTIDKSYVLGPHKMKMSHYFSVFDTLWNFGLFFDFSSTPPPPKEMKYKLGDLERYHNLLDLI